MPREDARKWCPFRPGADDMQRIARDVAEIPEIQQKTLAKSEALKVPDRVAHQYQIAGSKVRLKIADTLPPAVRDVGVFIPGSQHIGIGRLSTGLGGPHVEPNPDFLGLLLAFQTPAGVRVDFLAINDPASPADDHHDFMSIPALRPNLESLARWPMRRASAAGTHSRQTSMPRFSRPERLMTFSRKS